jgi:hypothetical protein
VVSIFEQHEDGEAGPLSLRDYLSLKDRLNEFEWIGAAHLSSTSVELSNHSAIITVAGAPPDLAGVLISHWNEGSSSVPVSFR